MRKVAAPPADSYQPSDGSTCTTIGPRRNKNRSQCRYNLPVDLLSGRCGGFLHTIGQKVLCSRPAWHLSLSPQPAPNLQTLPSILAAILAAAECYVCPPAAGAAAPLKEPPMRRFCGRDSWQGQGVMDHLSQRSHRGRLRKDLSKLCKMFPDSMRFGIRTIFCKTICNNNLHQWHRVGNGPCLFQCAKDGVSSVLAGQGKRRGRATQRLRPHFPDTLTGPVSSVKPHAGKRQPAYRTFSRRSERPAGPGRSLFSWYHRASE